ncbi:ankyrin repeat and SOCS box protein 10-like isoform X2 [Mercenaria mercenaria]|uniref:ankyrin repeat and SOCS box protein 10-like isoform X2 n=1 Tax=Mercenaria mercenaria TaxID=6596 RepID=UPI00234F5870|nr:ankyrin repeat and SOCS box protein 10-like isoform X2 [Mercenaria mercenaria]
MLLRNGANPDVWLEDVSAKSGKYLLHTCCEKGRYKCAKVLLDYGAQADIQGSWGQTPLMLCMLIEYFEIAELLIKSNRKVVDQQDSSGNTPLHYAIGNDSVEGVKLLLKYNPDVSIFNIFGITPLMKICSTKESEHMEEIVDLLVDAGAQIDEKDFKSKRTALQRAAMSTNIPTVQFLLNCGADPNTVDSSGRTPASNLIWEHIRTHPGVREIDPDVTTIMHMLVMAGSSLDGNRYENSSPLILAINFKCTSLVNYLLVHGAKVEGDFFGGISPLLHVIKKKDIDTMKVLLNWSCDLHWKARVFKFSDYEMLYDSFELAIHEGCPEMALLLVQVGYNVSKIKYLSDYSSEVPECLKNRPDILEQLRQYVQEPRSLFDSTVLCIRQTLGDNISHKAEELPLPRLLIDDIKLKAVLD